MFYSSVRGTPRARRPQVDRIIRRKKGVLSSAAACKKDYIGKILPERIRLVLIYRDNHNMFTHLKRIFKTVVRIYVLDDR